MPSKIIPCIDCEKEREALEKSGAFMVKSCTPLPEDADKPENQQRCELVWESKPI